MAATELRLVQRGLNMACPDGIERIVDGRSQLLRFETSADPERVAAVVGRLSAAAALFSHGIHGSHDSHGSHGGEQTALHPITIDDDLAYGSDLVTIQRYRGKTNERLTRAMLNVALATAGIDLTAPTGTVLDPMCGRGTTLNWALAYGLDAIGVDADGGSLDQHATFLQTWAKRQRLPHKPQRHRAGNAEQRVLTLEIATDRATLKAEQGQTIQTFAADGADRSLPIKRGRIDVIVTDLPYGVQHRGDDGRPAGGNADGATGDTGPLLARVLDTWHRWLRPGGALCLAWNLKRASRDEVGRLLADNGFSPVTVSGGHSMRHVVDATIDRDVIVATR